ncbi:MAG: 2-oxo acid dehydrogenase subunit E2 [Candidatus Hydrogenedentes bacterium]|nr:2-oxo acid dehydrogenase subunit E2 [Candidatus Hydrogenedentota bacterium]
MSVEFKLPALAENVDKVTVTKLLVAVGDDVRKDQPVMEIETDKASTEVPSSVSGKVTEIRAREGQPLRVGDVVMVVSGNGAPAEAAKPAPQPQRQDAPVKLEAVPAPRVTAPAPVAAPAARVSNTPVPASPSVRRLAREIGIDVSDVPGTGPGGRVTIEDVKSFSRQARNDVRPARAPAPVAASLASSSEATAFGEVERIPMNSVRRRTSENMTHAWTTIPHVTQFDKADITGVERFRQQYGKRVEAAGGKLTVTAILVKLLATALKKFPQFNASIDVLAQEITYKKYYNIGVAVDTDRGLLVPVVRNVDTKSVIEIAVELQEMAARAREKKNRLEEMQGATFTISNLGGIGGTSFTPIINPPEAAILGVSRGRIEPVYIDGAFQPRTMLPLSLSYDHRVIDGADAARFVRWIVDALEQPLSLLLDN